jgi:3-hydroxyisobutyrate dehydrogenase
MVDIGWIGLGAMGAPMAAVLARAGHKVAAYDVNAAPAPALAGDGVVAAETVADAARDAEVLGIMVATAPQAEEVLFGQGGAAAVLREGAVVLVMCTVGPKPVEDWAERLGGSGVLVVDAPVSGGAARAAAGDLLMMVSGPETALETAQPLLDALSRTSPVVGPRPGDGQKVKLVNQLLCGVHIAVAAEGLAFAESLGLDAGSTWEVLRHGAAASFMLEDRGARMIENPSGQVRSALDIFVKDMGLVLDAAQDSDFAAPLATTAAQLYDVGRRAGLGRADDSSLIEVLRGRADVAPNGPAAT